MVLPVPPLPLAIAICIQSRDIVNIRFVGIDEGYGTAEIIYRAPDSASFRIVGKWGGCLLSEDFEAEIIGNIYANPNLLEETK